MAAGLPDDPAPRPAPPAPFAPASVTPRLAWALLAATVLLAATLRVGQLPAGHGGSWDSPGYVNAAEHLDQVLGGGYPSVYGTRAPHIYPLGLPLLVRLGVGLTGAETLDVGVAVALLAGVASVVCAFFLARELWSSTAGIVAAVWVALDPALIAASALFTSESVCGLLVLGSCALAARGASSARATAGAGALLAAAGAWSVRMAAAPLLPLVALAVCRSPATRRPLLALGVGLFVLVLGASLYVGRVNRCAPYWRSNLELTLYDEGIHPGLYTLGEDGTCVRYMTEPLSVVEVARQHAGTLLGVAWRCVTRAATSVASSLALTVVALVALRADPRRRAAVAWTCAVAASGVALPIATAIHPHHILRMLEPYRGVVHAAGAVGACCLLGTYGRRTRSSLWRSERGALLLAAAAALAVGAAQPGATLLPVPASLRALGDPASRWHRARAFAREAQRHIPADARVLRGVGVDQGWLALLSRHYLWLPDARGQALARYLEANRVEFVLHLDGAHAQAQSAMLAPGLVTERLAELEGERPGERVILSRIRPAAPR